MSLDWDLQEKIDIVSGAAEARIAERKLVIAAERDEARRHLELSKRVRKEVNIDPSSALLPTVAALTDHERRNFSLGKAINYQCRVRAGDKSDCLEAEISRSIAADLKQVPEHGGLFIPTRIFASGQDSNTYAGGKYLVGTQLRDLVDLLRSQLRLTQLGATFLDGLRRPTQFTTELTASKAYWISENGGVDVTQQDLQFGAVTLTAHTLQSTVAISRQLLQQNSVSLDRRIGMDITRSVAIALEAAAINGSGSAGEPQGLLRVPGITTVSLGTNGAKPSYANICALESAVANANAEFSSVGFLSTPSIREVLRQVFVNGTGSDPVWTGDSMLEKPALVSTGVPSNLSKGTANQTLSAILCGAWSEMLIAEFAVMELVTDPFSRKKQGVVEVTSFSLVDVGIPRPASFAVIADAALS